MQDLILLENQLTFFILDMLFQHFNGAPNSFFKLARNYFFTSQVKCSKKEVKHFTGLQRYFFLPPDQKLGNPIEHRHGATKLEMAGLIFQTQIGPEKKRSLLNVEIQKGNSFSEIFPCFNCSWLLHCLPCLKKISFLKRMQTLACQSHTLWQITKLKTFFEISWPLSNVIIQMKLTYAIMSCYWIL